VKRRSTYRRPLERDLMLYLIAINVFTFGILAHVVVAAL
jgi:hypothetical protein